MKDVGSEYPALRTAHNRHSARAQGAFRLIQVAHNRQYALPAGHYAIGALRAQRVLMAPVLAPVCVGYPVGKTESPMRCMGFLGSGGGI